MKPIVLDASAAASWIMPDEVSDAAVKLYAEATQPNEVFHAPSLWIWETGNILVMGQARGRIDQAQAEHASNLLAAAHISFDPVPSLHRRGQIMRLAQAHGLTFYDACYLELVLRLNGQLASLDKKLVAAGRACGIVCLSF